MTPAILALVGQLVVEAIKRVDYKLLADVFGAIQDSETSDDLDKLILLARLESLSLEMTTAAALKETEAIGAL